MVTSLLEAYGCSYELARDGASALEMIDKKKFDLVLMDIQMPGMDGVTATKRIRTLPGRASRVPIVAMTANVLPQQIAVFRAAGMNDHVGKPFKREDLFAAIKRCVTTETPAGQLSQPASQTTGVAGEPDSAPAVVDASSPPAEPDSHFPVCDAETFDAMMALLGREKIDRLLAQLETLLQGRFTRKPESAEERHPLAREAHKLVSSAGMLGFLELSGSCSKLEAVLNTDEDATECFEKVRLACQQALTEIAAKMKRSGNLRASA